MAVALEVRDQKKIEQGLLNELQSGGAQPAKTLVEKVSRQYQTNDADTRYTLMDLMDRKQVQFTADWKVEVVE
jgi:hypothetical protein